MVWSLYYSSSKPNLEYIDNKKLLVLIIVLPKSRMLREWHVRICAGAIGGDFTNQMRLWRYLSGISSLLGAMNFCLSLALSAKARHIFVLTLLFLRDFVPRIIKYGVLSLPYPLWGSGKRYYSRSNSNSNNDNHKLPKNGKDK